jgi:hypothetical protein
MYITLLKEEKIKYLLQISLRIENLIIYFANDYFIV